MAKIALLIGVSEYEPGLNPLPGAVKDVEAMKRVLVNPEMGGFAEGDIKVLKNPQRQEMEDAIYGLFANRQKEDLVLFYFSGHGVKDEGGKLYLSTRATRKDNGKLVKPSAVAASTLHDSLNESRCQRQVVILDCCFSGAIAQGMTIKDDGIVNLEEQLGGKGRAILTSSTSTQYSFEQEGSEVSIYTRYLVEGIEKGAADQDNDGWISVDDLHDYASRKVREEAPAMTPKFYPVEEGHKILLAKSPKDDPKLKYRKEVESRSSRGHISVVGRRILDDLRDSLGLKPEAAAAIEDEVMKPYREYQTKLQRYEQAFAEAVQQENPISDATGDELKRYQEILGLRDRDIAPVEGKYLPPRKAAESQIQPVITSDPSVAATPQVDPQYSQQRVAPQRKTVQPQSPPQENTPTSNSEQSTQTKVPSSIKSKWFVWLATGGLGLLGLVNLSTSLNEQAIKGVQTEGRQYVSSLNKANQAYFTENGEFTSSFEKLGVGIKTQTENYTYKVQTFGSGNKNYAISTATARNDGLKSYTGGVFLVELPGSTDFTAQSIICESTQPSKNPPAPPKVVGNELQCASGSVKL